MLHRLADAMGHRIEPLVDRARHLGLAAGQGLGHGVGPAGGLALGVEDLAQPLLELVGPDGVCHGKFRAAPPGACDDDGYGHQQDEDERAEADQRIHRRTGQSPSMKMISFMPALLANLPGRTNE